ncbi:MerR family transcriptional regulator [Mycobacterium kyogaense]|uniref:MerR family transcriptional regulator n=1 Tax=Mycobacterium kyogaense TaxID=2212479 RepID=UPI000DAC4C8F|nr:MerR family transcriptional regulator [Mycobacterium kyogaense]
MIDTAESASFSIGEVAAAVGMSVHALRFYERQDLLVGPIRRTSGGRRRYTDIDIDWLRICVRLRESGMPLSELQRFAALVRQGPGNENERLALLDAQRDRVEQQIHALEQAREIIAWKTDVYRSHLQNGDAGLWDPTR